MASIGARAFWFLGLCGTAAAPLTSACGHRPSACQQPPDCGDGQECLAFRCVPRGMDPVAPDSERQVVLPVRLGAGPPFEAFEHTTVHEVALGPPSHLALYAAFDFPRQPCAQLDAAFLLLEAPNPGQSAASPIEVSIRRVEQAWSTKDLSEGDLPDDGLPEARGLVRPPLTARIDVTDVVCNALDTGDRSHGIVVRSLDGSRPLRIATGLGSEQAPRIELYLRARSEREPAP